MTKVCTKCKESKALEEFSKKSKARDGLQPRCKACISDDSRNYYLKNRGERISRASDYYLKNRGERIEYAKAHGVAYRARRPEVAWASGYRFRARKAGFEPVVEDFTRDDVIERYGDACAYCEDGAFEHLDHVVAVADGGHHTLENVRPSCASCNRSKWDYDLEEWLAKQDAEPTDAEIDAEIAKWVVDA